MRHVGLLCIVTAVVLSLDATGATESENALFNISTKVVQKAERIVPLGLNNFGDIGAVNYSMNNFLRGEGDEPGNFRYLWRVKTVGDGWVELDGPGTTGWKQYADGFLSGADVRLYRLLDKDGNKLPVATDKKGNSYLDTTAADHVQFLGRTRVLPAGAKGFPKGGWIANEQEKKAYFESGPPLHLEDYVLIEKRFTKIDPETVHERHREGENGNWKPTNARLSLVPHAQPVPSEMLDPGKTCLLIEAGEGEASIAQPNLFTGTSRADTFWYSQLEPGKHYRLEVWLRQEKLADDGKVIFSFTDNQYRDGRTVLNVTDKWQRFTHDFVAGERPENAKIFGAQFVFQGPGKLWLENARLFRWDSEADLQKPFVPNRTLLETAIASQPPEGRKGALRIWSGLSDVSMQSLCSWHMDGEVEVDRGARR